MFGRPFRRSYTQPIPAQYVYPRPAPEPIVIDVNYRPAHRRHRHYVAPRDDSPILPSWAVPGTICAFRCGNPRMYGSTCCKHDTCKTEGCFKPSRVRNGCCTEHGCGADGCPHSRQLTKMESAGACVCRCNGGRHELDCEPRAAYHLSPFCKKHLCTVWACDIQGRKDWGGYCYKHHLQRFTY